MRIGPKQANKSVGDAIELLLQACSGEGGVGVRELARRLDQDPSRISRLLGTLAAKGLLMQDAQRRYHPGSGLQVLSSLALHASGILPRAAPALRGLQEATGGIVGLGLLWGREVSYLLHWDGQQDPLQAAARSGLWPASSSGIGLALLSQLPEEVLQALYPADQPCPSWGSGTELLAGLEQFRRQGCSRHLVFPERGHWSVGSCFTDGQGRSYGFCVSGVPGEGHSPQSWLEAVLVARRRLQGD